MNDQINKLSVCLFSQYNLAQVVNIISQVGLTHCSPVLLFYNPPKKDIRKPKGFRMFSGSIEKQRKDFLMF